MVNTTPPGASCVVSQLGKPLGIAEPTPAIAIATLGEARNQCRVPPPRICRGRRHDPGAIIGRDLPGYNPNRRPEIDYNTRVDITMTPAP